MSPRTITLFIALSVSGCTTLADVSAGQVGCAPADITISDEHSTWAARTWTAECDGKRFHCSSHGGGEGSTAQVSCAPAGGTAVPGGADAPAGCEYDTQCKGDRICQAGACVEPAVSAPAPEPAAEPEPSTDAPATPPPEG
jgi:hypothetical protein